MKYSSLCIYTVLFCFIISCNTNKESSRFNPVVIYNKHPKDEKIHKIILKKVFELSAKDTPIWHILAVNKKQEIYAVTETNNPVGDNKVTILDQRGNYLSSFGRTGQGPGEFTNISSLKVIEDTVYVFDNAQKKINRFNLSGEYIDMQLLTKDNAIYRDNKKIIYAEGEEKKISDKKFIDLSYFVSFDQITQTSTIFSKFEAERNHNFISSLFDNNSPKYIVDQKNKKLYIGTPSDDKYEIKKFDINGHEEMQIAKRHMKVKNSNQDIENFKRRFGSHASSLDIENMPPYNCFFMDKHDRLLVNVNVFRTEDNKNDYFLDVFDNGVYLFRAVMPGLRHDNYNEIVFIDNKIFIMNSYNSDANNSLACYEYEIE